MNFFRTSNSTPTLLTRKVKSLFKCFNKKPYISKDASKIKSEIEGHQSKNKLILKNIKKINKNNKIDNNISVNNDKNILTLDTISNKSKNINNRDIICKKNPKTLNTKIVNNDTKINIESYSQNFNLSLMKKYPPKLPEMLNYEHDIQNKSKGKFFNTTHGQLSKGKIPNVFFGHLMVESKIKKNKYVKSSATQRNKNKLLTILYYKPL